MLVIVDIDGTIADATKRFAEAGPEPSRENKVDYLAWLARVQNNESLAADKSVPGMALLCRSLYYNDCQVVYVTSREEQYRDVTIKWLIKHKFPTLALVMRPTGDWRSSGELKETLIKSIDTVFSTVLVLDDDEKGDLEIVCKKNRWTFLKSRSGGQK